MWAPAFANSYWIWGSALVTDPNADQSETFSLTFNLPGTVSSSALVVGADDYVVIGVNGAQIASETGEGNFLEANLHTYQRPDLFHAGVNIVTFKVTNAAYVRSGQGTPQNNPAGLLFKLSIEGLECANGSSGGTSHRSGGSGSIVFPAGSRDASAGNSSLTFPSNTGTGIMLGGIVSGASIEASSSATSSPADAFKAAYPDTSIQKNPTCVFLAVWVLAILISIEYALSKFLSTKGKSDIQRRKLRVITRALFSILGIAALWYLGEACAAPVFAALALFWVALSVYNAAKRPD